MQLRNSNIEKLKTQHFDVLIIGGGINGAVSAAALSGKGVKVGLIDKGDFAGFTSQESSNLAWGGIKYLETFEFELVRKLCKCRNHLIDSYPSIVEEIRFFTTIEKGFRFHPAMIYMGTWLYWLIGRGFTKKPRYLTPNRIQREEPVVNTAEASGGFEYSDAYLHDCDARFVFNFIRTAMNNGCIAANYIESTGAAYRDGQWIMNAKNTLNGDYFNISAQVLINAAGPFVDQHNLITGQKTDHHHVFSKGIHLLVDQITPHKRVLTFFADDGRLFFAIPMGNRTCLGTTDERVETPHVKVTDEDRQFVLDNINKRLNLAKPLTRSDVIAERCGVRPLVVEGSDVGKEVEWVQLSRKHAVEANYDKPHISIFGGKLTDCLNVGDEVSEIIGNMDIRIPYPAHKWYGDPHPQVKADFFHQARLMDLDGYTASTSSEKLSTRLWRRYGSRAIEMLETIREDPREAELLIKGTEYIRCEIQHAARREMVTKLSDFLRRRSKIALVVHHEDIRKAEGLMETCEILFKDQAQAKFDEYFKEKQT
ncbi:MAG: glycerol-3-phosphate dehydrogenase/oxidase [Deltaproteobacteria bacterium]|nr:glycerol-3-phosphate dehydrogenase/oxidase [Deltaproteobacteria bacterium]